MLRRFVRVPAVLIVLLAVACSGVAPGSTPTSQPTAMETPTPTATVAAEETATPTVAGSPAATPCDEYDIECLSNRTPAPSPSATMDEPSPPTSQVVVTAISYGELGAYLAGPTQMALYTFDHDHAGGSACTGDCAQAWPPLTVAAGATPAGGPGITGELATIERADGSQQVTYDGAPLYYFAGDEDLYDVNGDGVNGVWHLARP